MIAASVSRHASWPLRSSSLCHRSPSVSLVRAGASSLAGCLILINRQVFQLWRQHRKSKHRGCQHSTCSAAARSSQVRTQVSRSQDHKLAPAQAVEGQPRTCAAAQSTSQPSLPQCTSSKAVATQQPKSPPNRSQNESLSHFSLAINPHSN